MTTPQPLDYQTLRAAVRGSAAGIRLRVKLQPLGGIGTKVFPPTYAGGVYATEKRRIREQDKDEQDKEEIVECVLLDSVQSQANRLEQCLLQAYKDGKLIFPLLSVEFPKDLLDVGEVTTLDAPHRIFDAILRDSEVKVQDGKEEKAVPFRSQLKAGGVRDPAEISPEGKAIAKANVRNATPLFELCPTALIFGAWDSTGTAGGLGNKFARAIVSEIVAIAAVYGVRTASRLDPLGITRGKIFVDANGDWTPNEDKAKKDKVKKDKEEVEESVPFARKKSSKDKGTPSEINHSNIPPDIVRYDDSDKNTPDILRSREVNVEYSVSTEDGDVSQQGLFRTRDTSIREKYPRPGGVTFRYAEQTTVLSLAALRRLRFPVEGAEPIASDEKRATEQRAARAEADPAARTVLAALALAAVAHQIDPPDYFLRSNCQLVLADEPLFEIVCSANKVDRHTLTADEADQLFKDAVSEWKETWKKAWTNDDNKLPWREQKMTLTPKQALVDLVVRSRELGGGTD